MTPSQHSQGDPDPNSTRSGWNVPESPPETSFHRTSHLHLVASVPRYGPRAPRLKLDAVCCPTNRGWPHSRRGIALALRIAEERHVPLVIICSEDASNSPMPLPRTDVQVIIIHLPPSPGRLLPHARNARHKIAIRHRKADTGLKRNLMLALAHLCGWKIILMLDDDISTRPASEVPASVPRQSANLPLDDTLADFANYPSLKAAGFLQRDFNDNSVVCHIRNYMGHEQSSFISGGALLIRCEPDLSYFPSAYNEDWLFLFPLMIEGEHSHPSSAVKQAGVIHQSPYYPFTPERAQSQELGDVLAEGLFSLLDQHPADALADATSAEYWRQVIRLRQDMILDLLREARTKTSATGGTTFDDIDQSLRAALSVYSEAECWHEQIASYCFDLTRDLVQWRSYLAKLSTTAAAGIELPEALGRLGLADSSLDS